MNGKEFAETKTIPALKRLLENLEAGAPALIIDDLSVLFSDSYLKLCHGDHRGLKYRAKHPYDMTSRSDAKDGIELVQKYVDGLLCCKEVTK